MANDIWREVLKRRSLQDRLSLRNITSIAELAQIFEPTHVNALKQYQDRNATTPSVLLDSPFNDKFVAEYGQPTAEHPHGTTHLFTHNQAFYDDPIEDILDEDPVITALKHPDTKRGRTDEEVMDAVRARRTAVAFLMQTVVEPPITEMASLPDFEAPAQAAA